MFDWRSCRLFIFLFYFLAISKTYPGTTTRLLAERPSQFCISLLYYCQNLYVTTINPNLYCQNQIYTVNKAVFITLSYTYFELLSNYCF